MKAWTRWQDWTALVVGVYAFLSPIWTTTSDTATTTLIVLGILTAVASLWSLAQPAARTSEWVHAVLGVLFFIAPWVLGYTAVTGAAWTSWIVGVVAFVVGLTAIPASQAAHGGRMVSQH